MSRSAILTVLVLGILVPSGFSASEAASQLPAGIHDPPLSVPGEGGRSPREKQQVEFLAPGQATIPAHRSAEVELHFRVADGLHINSHFPREKTLIPTRLMVEEPHGLDVTAVDFPPGASFSPSFAPQEKLSVYNGDFLLRAHITARPGQYILHGSLRYQACDANSCTPPRSLPFEVGISAQ